MSHFDALLDLIREAGEAKTMMNSDRLNQIVDELLIVAPLAQAELLAINDKNSVKELLKQFCEIYLRLFMDPDSWDSEALYSIHEVLRTFIG